MSKVLVVFGATGQQGGSVVNYVINDSALSKEFKVRAITRDTTKPAAQVLRQKGAEIAKGDADDKTSLRHAMQGAHTVFAMTASVYDENQYSREYEQGKSLADAAIAAGAQYFIFSSLTHADKVTGGELKNMGHFNVKADIEAYIRTLPIKSAFFAPGGFMQNFSDFWGPRPAGDGTYNISNFVSPSTRYPLIDAVDDAGKYIGAILAEPEKYSGKSFAASTTLYSYQEIAETMSRASGKTVKYVQVPEQTVRSIFPPTMAGYMVDMNRWIQDFGYYGPKTEEEVAWTAKQARGKLTTLEEYFAKHPLHYE